MVLGAQHADVSAAAQAHAQAVCGDLSAAERLTGSLARSVEPEARAWAAALGAQIWLAAPSSVELPDVADLEGLAASSRTARKAALLAALDLALVRLIRFDGASFPRLVAAGDALGAGLDEEDDVRVLLLRAYAALASGDDRSAHDLSTEVATRSALLQLPSILVQAMALKSLSSGDDVDAALATGRRASLMGRSESLPHAEFLAHLALLRARRRAGQPHLALRIASAMGDVVTEPWRAILVWESSWAGGALPAPWKGDRSPADRAVAALADFLAAAQAGDRARSSAALERARAACEGFAPAARELRDLAACSGVDDAACSEAAAAFRAGKQTLTPPSLHGLKLRPSGADDTETAGAYVYRRPDGRATRVLHWGVPLLGGSVARVRQSQRTQGRIEMLLSILALSGPGGIEDAPCFEEAYGFRYVPELHRGVLEVLLHRARAAVDGVADIDRGPGRLCLRSASPLLIPDPRVAERTQDRILRYLALRGAASARDAALRLGVSLRAAQGALKELSSAGACQLRRDGRTVEYVVEDTVFSEPTQRLAAEGLRHLAASLQV
jgi:DNA-binding transcriptional ArsR family regulator